MVTGSLSKRLFHEDVNFVIVTEIGTKIVGGKRKEKERNLDCIDSLWFCVRQSNFIY